MLVAVRSGSCRDRFGRVLEIVAGQTRWCESSEELEDPAVAALFAPDPANTGRSRSRSLIRTGASAIVTAEDRNPGLRADTRGERPKLREKVTFPAQLKLGDLARRAIHDGLWQTTRMRDVESGGFLFGHRLSSRNTVIDIAHATGSGQAIRRHDSLTLDVDEWARAEHRIELDGFPLLISGCWHAHPATRNGKPSSVDLRSWLSMLDFAARRNYRSQPIHIGLIYTAHYDPSGYGSWAAPDAHGWVVHREGYTRTPFCDRLEIRGRG